MDQLFYIAEDLGMVKGSDYEVKLNGLVASFTFNDKQKAKSLHEAFNHAYSVGDINIFFITEVRPSSLGNKYSFKISLQ
ncbi:MAG: hypothetical protein ACLFUB_20475 [Cyclobacteriaceae bacterium]